MNLNLNIYRTQLGKLKLLREKIKINYGEF
jgi:hypothetical protein